LIVRSGGEEESSGGKAKHEADRGSSFTFTGRKRVQLLTVYRTLRLVGAPYTLPPGTPRDRVMILQDPCARLSKTPNFTRVQKLTGEDPDPLMPEEIEKAIREMPRDAEVIALLEKTFRQGPASRALNARLTHCRIARPNALRFRRRRMVSLSTL
jgi:hypothetical protein